MTIAGELALWMAGLFAIWVVVASIAGISTGRAALISSGARGLVATAFMLAVATLGIVYALVSRDYSLAFASATTSHALPGPYAAAALWSARAGAALLLALGIALPAAVVGSLQIAPRQSLLLAVLGGALSIVLAPILVSNALFERLATVAAEGGGLSPHLQSPFMLVQPPLIALGYGLALVHGSSVLVSVGARLDHARWQAIAQRFGVAAWVVVGLASLAALRWAYHEPLVEGAWLKRVTHDGSLWLWLAAGGSVAASHWRSRRALSVRAALAVIVIGLVAMSAIVWPLAVVERFALLVGSRGGIVGGVAILGLAMAAWAAGRRRSDPAAEVSRTRVGRLPLAIAGVGFALLVFAVIGVRTRSAHEVRLRDGVAIDLRDPQGRRWRLVSQGVSSYQLRNRDVRALAVELWRDGRLQGLVTSERWQAIERNGRLLGDPVTTTGVRGTALMDVRLTLAQTADGFTTARIVFEPFALWLWIGGTLLLLGGARAAVPR
jgi:cytochrome c biogenesis factor